MNEAPRAFSVPALAVVIVLSALVFPVLAQRGPVGALPRERIDIVLPGGSDVVNQAASACGSALERRYRQRMVDTYDVVICRSPATGAGPEARCSRGGRRQAPDLVVQFRAVHDPESEVVTASVEASRASERILAGEAVVPSNDAAMFARVLRDPSVASLRGDELTRVAVRVACERLVNASHASL